MRCMKKVAALFLILVLLASGAVTVLAEGTTVDYSGSLEAGGISQSINNDFFLNGFVPGGFPSYPTFGSRIKWFNDLRIIPNDQVTLKLRVSYLNDTTQSALPENNQFVFSRGFIDFTPNSTLSLRFGKQRLAWGTGYAWNPSDILDQPRNALTDVDDPEGVTALRGDLNFGPVTTQLLIVPDSASLDWESSGRALRVKASPGGVDVALGVIQKGTIAPSYTGDFAYSLAGLGLHGEVRYQSEGNFRYGRFDTKKDICDYLVGMDYNLPGGYYLACEYYHNDQAYKNLSELVGYFVLTSPTAAEIMDYLTYLGNNGGVMQNHIFLHSMKKFGEDFNVDLMFIYNPEFHSLVAQPKLEYIWGQNTSLFVKGLVNCGDANSEAGVLPIRNIWNLGMKVSF